jgi:type I restriction enzyme S subunit
MTWTRIKVGDLLARRTGTVNPSNSPCERFSLYSIPAFDVGAPEELLGSEIGSSKQVLQPGDVLLSKIVPHIRRCWVVDQTNSQYPIIGSSEWIVFRTDLVDAGYLSKVLVGDEFHNAFLQTVAGVGGSLKRARPTAVAEIEIPLPPLDEQRRIAAILDKTDVLRRQRQESLRLTAKLLQSVFIDMFGDPRENPKNWDVVPLGQLVADDDTINYGVVQPGNDYPDGVPLIRLGDLANPDPMMVATKRIDPEIDASYARSRLVGGEVLVGCVGHTIGVACIAPAEWAGANIARAVARINVRREIPAEFILEQIRTPAIQHFFRGERRIVGQPTLNIKQIKEAPILLPPSDLRDQFATFYQLTVNGHSDKLKSETLIDALFSTIQQRAFRGELDLSQLTLEALPAIENAPELPGHHYNDGVYNRPGFFIAPPEIEAKLKTMEEQLSWGPGDSIPWCEDYFKYRTLSQLLVPPFSFDDVWQKTIYDMEEADYETVKDRIFKYLASGLLVQEFDEERREIVFRPRT